MTVTKHLHIHGRVQGVGFRAAMLAEAEALGLTGWVRNHRDGTVEAMVQGDQELISAIIDWALRGPAGSRVTSVDIGDGHGDYTDFQQLPTG